MIKHRTLFHMCTRLAELLVSWLRGPLLLKKRKWLSLIGMSPLPSTAGVRRLHRHFGFVQESNWRIARDNLASNL